MPPASQAVYGTLKLPDNYPSVTYDQTYIVRLSSENQWIGQDIVTVKQGERSADFIIPNRIGAEKAIISWGLGTKASNFYSNGVEILRGVHYADDTRQWLNFSNLPDNIEIIPTLMDNKLFDIECFYETFDKYYEDTDIYSGTETRISEIMVTRSIPLPQNAYLCAYTAQGRLLGLVSLPADQMSFTIFADEFSHPRSIAKLKIFLWNDELVPVWNPPTADVILPH